MKRLIPFIVFAVYLLFSCDSDSPEVESTVPEQQHEYMLRLNIRHVEVPNNPYNMETFEYLFDTITVETFKEQLVGTAWKEVECHEIKEYVDVWKKNLWEEDSNYIQPQSYIIGDSSITIYYTDIYTGKPRYQETPYTYTPGSNNVIYDFTYYDKIGEGWNFVRREKKEHFQISSFNKDTMNVLRKCYIVLRRMTPSELEDLQSVSTKEIEY